MAVLSKPQRFSNPEIANLHQGTGEHSGYYTITNGTDSTIAKWSGQKFEQPEQLELDNLDADIKVIWRKSVVRNSLFRKSVVYAYNYRCAFCQLRITRNPTQNIVDGAHIKPFAEFGDSKIDNGLSLCKNHHWAFDLGWFTVDSNYKILVARDLEDDSPHTRSMKDFHNESISLPSREQYFPRLEALEWHRQNKFKA